MKKCIILFSICAASIFSLQAISPGITVIEYVRIKSTKNNKYFAVKKIDDTFRLVAEVGEEDKEKIYQTVFQKKEITQNNIIYSVFSSDVASRKNLQSCDKAELCKLYEVRFFSTEIGNAENWQVIPKESNFIFKNEGTKTYLTHDDNGIATTGAQEKDAVPVTIEQIDPASEEILKELDGKFVRIKSNSFDRYLNAHKDKEKKTWIARADETVENFTNTRFTFKRKVDTTLFSLNSEEADNYYPKDGISELPFVPEKHDWELVGYSKDKCFIKSFTTKNYLAIAEDGKVSADVVEQKAEVELSVEVIPPPVIDLTMLDGKYVRIKLYNTNNYLVTEYDKNKERWIVRTDAKQDAYNGIVFKVLVKEDKDKGVKYITLASDLADDKLVQVYKDFVICEGTQETEQTKWELRGFNFEHCFLLSLDTKKYLSSSTGPVATATKVERENKKSEIAIEILPDCVIDIKKVLKDKTVKITSNNIDDDLAAEHDPEDDTYHLKPYTGKTLPEFKVFKVLHATDDKKEYIGFSSKLAKDQNLQGTEKQISFSSKDFTDKEKWELIGYSLNKCFLKNKAQQAYLAIKKDGTVHLSKDKTEETELSIAAVTGINVESLKDKHVRIKSKYHNKYFIPVPQMGRWTMQANVEEPNFHNTLIEVRHKKSGDKDYIGLISEGAGGNYLQSCKEHKHWSKWCTINDAAFAFKSFGNWEQWELLGVSLDSCFLKNKSTKRYLSQRKIFARTDETEMNDMAELSIEIVADKDAPKDLTKTLKSGELIRIKSNYYNTYFTAMYIKQTGYLSPLRLLATSKEPDYTSTIFYPRFSGAYVGLASPTADFFNLRCTGGKGGSTEFVNRTLKEWESFKITGTSLSNCFIKSKKTGKYLAPDPTNKIVGAGHSLSEKAELSIEVVTPQLSWKLDDIWKNDPEGLKILKSNNGKIRIKANYINKYYAYRKGRIYADTTNKADPNTVFGFYYKKSGDTDLVGIKWKKQFLEREAWADKPHGVKFFGSDFYRGGNQKQWQIAGFDPQHCFLRSRHIKTKDRGSRRHLTLHSKNEALAHLIGRGPGSEVSIEIVKPLTDQLKDLTYEKSKKQICIRSLVNKKLFKIVHYKGRLRFYPNSIDKNSIYTNFLLKHVSVGGKDYFAFAPARHKNRYMYCSKKPTKYTYQSKDITLDKYHLFLGQEPEVPKGADIATIDEVLWEAVGSLPSSITLKNKATGRYLGVINEKNYAGGSLGSKYRPVAIEVGGGTRIME